ncbi:Uridine nucleosidase 1 [Oleoguttula sp. CCFEE 5521]
MRATSLVLPFILSLPSVMTNPSPVWLDVDTGHDDAFAILLACHSPNVRLLGISTVFGNAPLSHTTENTLSILSAIGRTDVPLYSGASKPFCRAAAAAPDIHGETGLDGTTCLPAPSSSVKTDVTAIEAAYRALIAQPADTAWLICTGAFTNAALLFAIYPDLASHLKGFSVMGGAIGGGFTDAPLGTVKGQGERFGNWTPWAEFNIYIDPESAQALFSNPVLAAKTTLIPLDLTHQFLATKEVQSNLLYGSGKVQNGQSPTLVRKLFVEILTFFAKTYADVFGLVEGPPLHDPLAVVAAFAPALLDDQTGERFAIHVITDGEHGQEDHVRSGKSQCGRTVATKPFPDQSGIRIPRGLQESNIWNLIDEALAKAEQASLNA